MNEAEVANAVRSDCEGDTAWSMARYDQLWCATVVDLKTLLWAAGISRQCSLQPLFCRSEVNEDASVGGTVG